MNVLRSISLFTCLAVLVSSGCGQNSTSEDLPSRDASPVSAADTAPPSPNSSSSDDASVEAPEDAADVATGTVRGLVTYAGDVPPPRIIQATKDPEYCSAGEGEVQDVQVSDGRLAGAIIELTIRGTDLPDFEAPEDGFVIRQKDCRFSPRLLVAFEGAELVVYNDDRVEHNVNTGQWNLIQSPGADPIRQKLSYGGTPFTRVTCNIHNWMESWVYVARSPFYAATNEAGEFQIPDVPAGTRIRGTATHATLGRQRFTVDVVAGEETTLDLEFEAG